MNNNNHPHIAAISMMRNDSFFAGRWIDYYSSRLGSENLFLIIDGHDQDLPDRHMEINTLRLPHRKHGRSGGDRSRARIVSFLARSLFHRYDIIIAHDIDEFLVVDPETGLSFSEYFSHPIKTASLSALGLDVGQHTDKEKALDKNKPFLEQRSYAHVSARYTKAVVATQPIMWGSGFHRVKGRNFRIAPELYLFHFGMVDYDMAMEKIKDKVLLDSGWKGHLERRYDLFELIRDSEAMDGDDFFAKARKRQSVYRPFYALNKPGMLKEKPIIRIPERFRTIV